MLPAGSSHQHRGCILPLAIDTV